MAVGLLSNTAHSSVLYGQDYTSIGVSSFVYESPYTDDGIENTWSPFLALQYGNFFVRGVEAGYQLVNDYDYGAAISISGDELYRKNKNPNRQQDGQGNNVVSEGLNIKGSISLYQQSGIYTLSAMQDISDVHEGIESTVSWMYTLRSSSVTWFPSLYMTWMDDKLVEHYFASNNLREEQNMDSGWRYGAGLTMDYHPSSRWLVQGNLANESVSEQVTRGSQIEKTSTWLMSINIGYYL